MRLTLSSVLLVVAASGLEGQGGPVMVVPRESQHASVSQTVGLSDLSVSYNRPGVKGRKIWGALVPFDSVWRAGANENTVFASTSAFTFGGQRLPAGRYGLHTIPSAGAWTVILSREANNWGSFSYDPKDDATRISATPVPAEFVEHLRYTFDDPADSSVTLTLRWEKLALPIPITVPTNQVVLDSLDHQLYGLQQFFPNGWLEASRWALQHNTGLDRATRWADRALAIQPSFGAMRLRANLAERQGNKPMADSLRTAAMALATEADINVLGYQLMGQGKTDEAIVLFRQNVRDYPRSWNVYDSLGEALAKKGNKKEALANYQKAFDLSPEGQHARIRTAMAALR